LHTNSLDEAWALPTEQAATLALRTQQILANETGITATADPLGGSYFVESLTNEVERGATDYIAKIDAMGGMVAAIERGYPQREIAEAAYRYQQSVDRKEKIVVGVNGYSPEITGATPDAAAPDENAAPTGAVRTKLNTLQIDETVATRQAERLRRLRAGRS